MRKTILSIFILFSVLTSKSQDFEVTPVKLYFNAEPGENQSKFIKVINHSNKIETFIIGVSDISIDSKGLTSYVEAGSMKNSIADLVVYSPSFFELNPNEEKEISITMQQPSDDFGSKWGILSVRTAKEQNAYSVDKNITTGINLSGRIIINIYQTPNTNKTYKATIGNLTEVFNSEADSIRTFNALINNMSDIITECNVYLIATNIENAEETKFPDMGFTMYPKSSRKIELYLPNSLPKGTYSLAAILDYGSKTNLEGTQIIIKVE